MKVIWVDEKGDRTVEGGDLTQFCYISTFQIVKIKPFYEI